MCAHAACGCIPVHSRTFIQINMFSGVLPTHPNPKPVAERGANVFPGDAAEKKRKRAYRLGGSIQPEPPQAGLCKRNDP